MSEIHSIDKSTQETNDISQGFLTWPQIKELLAWAATETITDIARRTVENLVWERQKFLTEAWKYETILASYYDLMKKGKL